MSHEGHKGSSWLPGYLGVLMHTLPDDISNAPQHQDLHLQQPLLHHALKTRFLQRQIHERTTKGRGLAV